MQPVLLFVIIFNLILFTDQKCGYESCPAGKDGMLNVHLVAHTHDDVGWLKTVDQYYYGERNDIQQAGVQYILDSVVDELMKHPDRKFTYVETAFFYRWWREQDEERRRVVRMLVEDGRLQFAGGGWSMNDEACAHYTDIIDQMTLGLRWLREELGDCAMPQVAWQIDPFGHSKEQANLFAQMGFDGLFFGRLDYADKMKRMSRKTMEMVWSTSHDLGSEVSLFTGALYNNYAPPPGHCYDISCTDEPIVDNPSTMDYNVDQKVDSFLGYAKKQSSRFASNHILMTMGEDFNYQAANMWFKNLDKLIKYVNQRQNSTGELVNVFYSTPACYLYSLNRAQLVWTTKEDDFLPYASDPWAYWTGYYTSRPAQKYYIRKSSNFLQAVKQMTSFSQCQEPGCRGPGGNCVLISHTGANSGECQRSVDPLRRAVAVNQHHDAVTGTEKQPVNDDYILRLHTAEQFGKTAFEKSLRWTGAADGHVFCPRLNMSECSITENSQQFIVYVYNPLAHARSHWLRLPVDNGHYTVLSPNGTKIASQLVPIAEAVIGLSGRRSSSWNDLVFPASDLPPLGYRAYLVTRETSASPHTSVRSKVTIPSDCSRPIVVKNDRLKLALDCNDHSVSATNRVGRQPEVKLSMMWYEGYGNASEHWNETDRPTGAYIFHPIGNARRISVHSTKLVDGPLVSEFQQTYEGNWASKTVRIYHNSDHVEADWVVGPIPHEDGVAKEVILRYDSTVRSGDLFYTDSNGRQMIERRRNHRPTWNLNLTEPVASNYYPVTTRIDLRDRSSQMTVITDRTQGGTSLKSQQMELMLHRWTVEDDGFGVGEPLNEMEFGRGLMVRGHHWIIPVSLHERKQPSAAELSRTLSQQMARQPILTFVDASNISRNNWKQMATTEFSGAASVLPANLHVLTLETVQCGRPQHDNRVSQTDHCGDNQWQLLLRLEHIYQKDEHAELSQPATVNIQDLLPTFDLIGISEQGLAADRSIREAKDRLPWRHTGPDDAAPCLSTPDYSTPFVVTLCPMEIRTFLLSFR